MPFFAGIPFSVDMDKEPVQKKLCHVDWDVSAAEKGGYQHFMAKEIMEQPEVLRDTISPRLHNGRVVLDSVSLTREDLEKLRSLYCGLWLCLPRGSHCQICAGKGLYAFPVEVDIASEFRYMNPMVDEGTLVLVISQSGETADIGRAQRG